VQSGGYFDGYFAATLEFGDAPAVGIIPLVVQWRSVDGSSAAGRDRFDIFRW
jgi:hypothetical protein